MYKMFSNLRVVLLCTTVCQSGVLSQYKMLHTGGGEPVWRRENKHSSTKDGGMGSITPKHKTLAKNKIATYTTGNR